MPPHLLSIHKHIFFCLSVVFLATLLAGGSAQDINVAANVSESALKHNRRLHPEELKILVAAQKGKTPEQKQRLALATAAAIKASAGVSSNDPQHGNLQAAQQLGQEYGAELAVLKQMAVDAGKPGLFEYSYMDASSDFLARNDEVITRGVGGLKFGLGSVGV